MEKKDIYEIYSEAKGWEKPEIHKNRIKEFEMNYLPFIKKNINSNILDVGCGSGDFLDFLKKYRFINYEGIDINKKLVSLCNLKGHKVTQADALNFIKSTTKTFDIMVFNDILEHFEKKDAICLIESAKKKLNKNGILLARVPNANYLFSNTVRYRDFTHVTIYEIESLEYLFKLCDYEIVYVGNFLPMSTNYLRFFFRSIILKLHAIMMVIMHGESRPNEANIFIVASSSE